MDFDKFFLLIFFIFLGAGSLQDKLWFYGDSEFLNWWFLGIFF